jgi:tRNA(fMet)-specific endonuclease VapC
MSLRYLLDTNICIYLRKNRPPGVTARFERMRAGEAAISVITYGELRYGAERSSQRERALQGLEQLLTLLPALDLPAESGIAYGEIRAQLAFRGEMIGGNDLWIAAHARAAGLVLVTNNEGEFRRISGLKIQNWAK